MIMALSWLWYHNHNHDSITIDRIIMMMGIVMITMVMMTIQDNHQNDNDDGNRFLPPDGMPSARRAAQDGDRLPCRLRGDARLHRQLCFHLPWLVPLPPSLTLGRNVFQWARSCWPDTLLCPLLFKATVHYVNLNVIITVDVFHRISNCWYMLSNVFCSSGQLSGKECEDFSKFKVGLF